MIARRFVAGFVLACAPVPLFPATAPAMVEELSAGLCASEYPSDSIAWAAACLVKAIRTEDRAALAALAAEPPDENFLWGEAPSGAARKTFAGVLANAETVEFIFYGDGGPLRAVAFYPGWDWEAAGGLEPLMSNENWLIEYFLCDYTFNAESNIWQIGPGFCYADTDGPFHDEDNHAH